MSVSIRSKTIKGLEWSVIDNVISVSVTFIFGIVFARLLSPDDFGLLGLVLIFTTILTPIVNGGLGPALIRKKDVTEDEYNTVFVTNLFLSLILYFVLYLSAKSIALFFERPELVPLIRISALGITIGALAIVQKVRLTREIDFKTQTKVTLISSLSSSCIGLLLVFLGFGVWSLVYLNLLKICLQTVLYFYCNRWLPKFSFSWYSFSCLFSYGWKIMISNTLDALWKDASHFVVGKIYSPSTLGQYTRSSQFLSLFSSNLTTIVQRVSFPVLSSIQDDKLKMEMVYKKIFKTTLFISSICLFFLASISEPLIYCLLGPKWHEASVYLPYMCVAGSIYPLLAINQNILQVIGRSDIFLSLSIVKKILGVFPIIVGAFVGVIPMLITSIIVLTLDFLIYSHFTGKHIHYSTIHQAKDFFPFYLLALLIVFLVYPLKYISISYWIILPLQLLIGATSFLCICEYVKLDEYCEIKSILLSLFRFKSA